jgi:hypothetical protein
VTDKRDAGYTVPEARNVAWNDRVNGNVPPEMLSAAVQTLDAEVTHLRGLLAKLADDLQPVLEMASKALGR